MARLKIWNGTSWEYADIQGPPGPGIAVGGTTGQVLIKNSAVNFDTSWGAVVESGSNANGNWVRYADGTQICTFKRTGSAIATGLIDGFVWTYPATFIAAPVFSVAVETNTTSGVNSARVRCGLRPNASPTVSVTVYSMNETTETVALITSVTATGRWK